MFDELHSSARLTGEVSSISKRDGKLWATPKTRSPVAEPGRDHWTGYFGRTGAHICASGGGSGKAMSLHLNKQAGPRRPAPEDDRHQSLGRAVATLRAMSRAWRPTSIRVRPERRPGAERRDHGRLPAAAS